MYFNLEGNNNGFPTASRTASSTPNTANTAKQNTTTETQSTKPSISSQEQSANAVSFLTLIPQLSAKQLIQFLSGMAAEFALVSTHEDYTRTIKKALTNAGVAVEVQYV